MTEDIANSPQLNESGEMPQQEPTEMQTDSCGVEVGDLCLVSYQEGDSKGLYQAKVVDISERFGHCKVEWLEEGWGVSQVSLEDIELCHSIPVDEQQMKLLKYRCLVDHVAQVSLPFDTSS